MLPVNYSELDTAAAVARRKKYRKVQDAIISHRLSFCLETAKNFLYSRKY